MVSDQARTRLVDAARAATAKAFLTSPGGTCYGAAALTRAAKVYTAGQYSSWNHVTNVHAEQAALVIVTMADDPDVVALALASTGDEPVARPCGVCRQVMQEHADRTGRDFEVLMAHRQDSGFDLATVSELLPLSWSARTRAGNATSPAAGDRRLAEVRLRPGPAPPRSVGGHVVLADGSVAMVWDERFAEGSCLVKIKYAPPDERGRRKVSHSFTEPLKYQRELDELGWARPTPVGQAAVVRDSDITGWLPPLALKALPEFPPGPLCEILADAAIDMETVLVSGSRSYGLHRPDSDWDLVVPATPGQLQDVRERLFQAIEGGRLGVPSASGTWRLLDRLFPGGRDALLGGRRFVDTVLTGGVSVALIFVAPETPDLLLDRSSQSHGRGLLHGTVVEATRAAYKRASYRLLTQDAGEIDVVCYHKLANLLRVGDRVSVRGWMLQDGRADRLIQMHSIADNIVWHDWSK